MTVYELWLPILAAGLATHVLCTIAWTVMPHHRPEWQKLPDEDRLHKTFTESVPPGQYVFPHARDGKTANTEEFQKKYQACSGMLIVWSSPTSMGKAILCTLTSLMVVAFVIGYLASLALPRGAEFIKVLQFTMTAGLLAHIAAKFPFVFWFRRKIILDVLDGVVYAVATGLIFAALWPK